MSLKFLVRHGETTRDIILRPHDEIWGESITKCSHFEEDAYFEQKTYTSDTKYCCGDIEHYATLSDIPSSDFSPLGLFDCGNCYCAGHPWPEKRCFGKDCLFYQLDPVWSSSGDTKARNVVLDWYLHSQQQEYELDEIEWGPVMTANWIKGQDKVIDKRMEELQKPLEEWREGEKKAREEKMKRESVGEGSMDKKRGWLW
ncbi:hypothetical protein BU16DRAFT_101511 [Lophium mytilinum]|uniref:Uncharacterized protein n=1 Tax=Lophium mytilinum TaxID=390894 RepID=A0A6A6QII9_9PEZI|nr:hypothetical protein BU16DRAFT_101511 [Lophium mytilinum]